jgi:hypothetical protein
MPQNASLFFSDPEKKGKQHERERERERESKARRKQGLLLLRLLRREGKRRELLSWRKQGDAVRGFTLRSLSFLPPGSLQYVSVFWNDPSVLSIIPGGQWAGTARPALGTEGKEGGKMRLSLSLSLSVPVWDPPPIICCDSFWRFWRRSFGNILNIFVLHRTSEHESHDAKHDHTGQKSPLKIDGGV